MTSALLERAEFPALAARPDVVFLDSASTTQKPARVLAAVSALLAGPLASPGRGSYPWSTRASDLVDQTRVRVATFIGARSDEVVFTAGATASLNAVASGWARGALTDGDEILYSPADHAANVYPWLALRADLARDGRRIRLIPYRQNAAGEADTADILRKVGPRTRLITVAHIHHVFGSLTTLEEIRGAIAPSVRVCFDCSQSVGHVPLDVRDLGADFVAFSAHKMFGLPGTGVLYCRRGVHEELGPVQPGGGTGLDVDDDRMTVAAMPAGWECGTPNLPGIVALQAAVDLLEDVGVERIAEHGRTLTRRLVDGLRAVPRVELLPGPAWCDQPVGYGIVSLALDDVPAGDLGFALAAEGFYVRAGLHCLPARHQGLAPVQLPESVRVSVHAHTEEQEIDRFVDYLARVAKGAI